jgi:hypothetical protein
LRCGLIGLGAFLLLFAVYSGYWLLAIGQLKSRTLAVLENTRTAESEISFGTVSSQGFPTRLELIIAEPLLRYQRRLSPSGAERVRWQGSALIVRAHPFRPTIITLDLPREAIVERLDSENTPATTTHYQAGLVRAIVQLGRHRTLPLGITVENVQGEMDSGPRVALLGALHLSGLYPESEGALTATWTLAARDIVPPPWLSNAAGPPARAPVAGPWPARIKTLRAKALLFGPWPERLRSNGAMAAWRDAGGRLELRDGSLESDSLMFDWFGEFRLDETLRPTSALTLNVQGLTDDGASEIERELGGNDALLLAILEFFSGNKATDQPTRLRLETHDGKAFLGLGALTIRIGKLGPINFEAPDGPSLSFQPRFK